MQKKARGCTPWVSCNLASRNRPLIWPSLEVKRVCCFSLFCMQTVIDCSTLLTSHTLIVPAFSLSTHRTMYGKTVCPPTCTITIPASTAQKAQLIVVQKDVTVHMTEELVAKKFMQSLP
eukprot:scpid92047/ scgid11718/ 